MKEYDIENMQDLRALYLNYAFEVNYIQCPRIPCILSDVETQLAMIKEKG